MDAAVMGSAFPQSPPDQAIAIHWPNIAAPQPGGQLAWPGQRADGRASRWSTRPTSFSISTECGKSAPPISPNSTQRHA